MTQGLNLIKLILKKIEEILREQKSSNLTCLFYLQKYLILRNQIINLKKLIFQNRGPFLKLEILTFKRKISEPKIIFSNRKSHYLITPRIHLSQFLKYNLKNNYFQTLTKPEKSILTNLISLKIAFFTSKTRGTPKITLLKFQNPLPKQEIWLNFEPGVGRCGYPVTRKILM